MAASDNVELSEEEKRKHDDFRESCSLCLEPYVGRTPKLLPCFHTFCLPCLTALADSVTEETTRITASESQSEPPEKQKVDLAGEVKVGPLDENDSQFETRPGNEDLGSGDRGDGEQVEGEGTGEESVEEKGERSDVTGNHGNASVDAVFLCPTCRAPVTVPKGGVSTLQTNFYIVREAEEAPQPVQCEMCEEEDRKEAEYTCGKCRQSMCRTCRRLHDKIVDTKKHQVRPLDIQVKTPCRSSKKEVKKCLVHQDQELCLFCKDCDVSICLVCKLTSHQPHQTEDMAVAALRGKEDLRVLVKTAREQVQVMEKLLIRLSRDARELSRQEQEAIHHVKGRYDEIIMWAGRARDELLETISSEGKFAVAGLKAEETSVRSIIDTLSRLVTRAAPAANDSTEVLLLKNELQAALLGKEQLEGHKEESEREKHRKFLLMKGDSSAVDLEVIRGFLGELSVGDSGDAAATFVSLRQQIQELDGKLAGMKTALDAELDAKVKGIEIGLDAKLNGVKTGLETKVDGLKTRLDTTVVFQVSAEGSSRFTIPPDGVLVLKQIQANNGNAYSATTGYFTVPVSGMYSFQATLRGRLAPQKGYVGPVELCAGKTILAEAVCDDEFKQISISTVVHVKKNQHVFLKNPCSEFSLEFVSILQASNSFSGFLLKAD